MRLNSVRREQPGNGIDPQHFDSGGMMDFIMLVTAIAKAVGALVAAGLGWVELRREMRKKE